MAGDVQLVPRGNVSLDEIIGSIHATAEGNVWRRAKAAIGGGGGGMGHRGGRRWIGCEIRRRKARAITL